MSRPLLPGLLLGFLALLSGFLGGCDDPTCVFAGNCFADPLVPEGALGSSAVEPVDGELILSSNPTVTGGGPGGIDRHSNTPVVLIFSETMAPDSVIDGFEIIDQATELASAYDSYLFSDGRVLVMLPRTPLTQGDYLVRVVDGAQPADLGGTALDLDASVDFPSFSIGSANPIKPVVVVSYPPNVSTNASTATEVVCIFDRAVNSPALPSTGWDVQVRPASSMTFARPAFDPDPQILQVPGFLFPVDEKRVWSWQSTDGLDPVQLETSGAEVSVTISPVGSEFTDVADMDQTVDELTFTFTLSTAPRPMTGLLNPASEPQDAIGIANLDGITAALNLALQVDFETDDLAMDGDVLTVFMFGPDPDDATNTIAFSRSITLSLMMDSMTETMDLADFDLVTSAMPLEVRLGDGSVRFAMRLERGADQGYLRVLDVDLVEDGVQNLILDTSRPEILLLDGQMTSTDTFVSDMADLVVVGHADVGVGDFVRGAVVSTMSMGDNIDPMNRTTIPEVIGSADSVIDAGAGAVASSLFIAAPVSIGRQAPASAPFNVTVTVYDRALNASETSLTVPFHQVGAVGTTPLDATDMTPLVIEVYDSETLQPISGALVYSHSETDDGMGNLSYPMLSGGGLVTDALGVVSTLPHHDGTDANQLATLVTVVAAGFDVFTFHGVPTTRLSIPLAPTQQVPGTLTGSVATLSTANISALARRVGDTRRSDLVFPTVATSNLPGGIEFDFTIGSLRPFRLGAQSFTAGVIDSNIGSADKSRLVKAFELRFPVDGQETAVAVAPGAFFVSNLLDETGIAADELPKDVTDVGVDASATTGMTATSLQNDTQYGREPLVTVEANLAGIDRPLPVGMGTAYLMTMGTPIWDIRSAYAGAADPSSGTLPQATGAELHLRVELREEDAMTMLPAATSGLRPKLSRLAMIDPLLIPDVPTVSSIAIDGTGMLTAPDFGLTFGNEIDNSSGLTLEGRGLYRVVLTEDLAGLPGRKWELYKLDVASGSTATVHFPNLAPDPVPIQSGSATTMARVSSFAWEGFPIFDPMDSVADVFLWSDIAREVESYAHSTEFSFTLQ